MYLFGGLMKRWAFLFTLFAALSCEAIDQPVTPEWDNLSWILLDSSIKIPISYKTVYEECFGEGNSLRLNQSMCISSNRIFCFNDGTSAHVFDYTTKKNISSKELPEHSHHNNAQFTDCFLQDDSQYPLLLLSRGDYPPNRNDLYLVQVTEQEETIYFQRHKTIHNILSEAANNGSWVVDEKNKRLFLYTMDSGDWRLKEDNVFTIYEFKAPDFINEEDVTLGYADVVNSWKYSYLIHQGGTYYNGLLFFNVQNLKSIYDHKLTCSKCVIAIDANTGIIKAYLPLKESIETEGICVYDNKLYISFKNGSEKQWGNAIVFKINEYDLPSLLFYYKGQ